MSWWLWSLSWFWQRWAGRGDGVDGLGGAAVDALEREGVLVGTRCVGRGCWDGPLPRWVLAVWVGRAVGLSPEPSGLSWFSDVDPDRWWAPHVEMLADLGIVSGCGTGRARYCSTDPVTRGQMATTLARAFALPPASPTGFVDIEYNVHAGGIDAAAALGIGTGCGV